jgi:acyl carrier protein
MERRQSVISAERVLEEVKRAIVEGLDTDADRVTPESSLIKDLGAESLDFLDINYRLEQAFGIKLARHAVLEHMEEMFGEESAVDADGHLTEAAVKVFRLRFREIEDQLQPGMDMDELPALVTVQSIADGVLTVLDTLPEACPHCGHAGWELEDGARAKCASCGEYGVYTNGDDLIKEWLASVQKEHNIF